MSNRREFIKNTTKWGLLGGALSILPFEVLSMDTDSKIKISLAQWSLHRTFFNGTEKAVDFPKIAAQKFDIHAVEYVSQFFQDKANDKNFLAELNKRSNDNNVKNVLIMVDLEGSLASSSNIDRTKAVDNHKKWVDAAHFLGCHAIRVNLHGELRDVKAWKEASIESLTQLSQYAKAANMNVIVENHGGFSSNGGMVAEVMKAVNLTNCGTLPDFGNFCMRREKEGDLWETPCIETYDAYKGVEELLPFAKGVSAKSFEFDANGNETSIDYGKMLIAIKKAKFNGYIGIEYEGKNEDEITGIKATKALIEKYIK